MSEIKEPLRRHVLTLTLGGDTIRDLISELGHIQFRLAEAEEKGENIISVVSGGYSTGFTLTMDTDPEMNHDKYMELINAEAEKIKARRKNEPQ